MLAHMLSALPAAMYGLNKIPLHNACLPCQRSAPDEFYNAFVAPRRLFCTTAYATHDTHVAHNVSAPVYIDHMACLHLPHGLLRLWCPPHALCTV